MNPRPQTILTVEVTWTRSGRLLRRAFNSSRLADDFMTEIVTDCRKNNVPVKVTKTATTEILLDAR